MVLRFKLTTAASKFVFLAAAFLFFSINSNAAGALDPTFGANGRAATTVGSGARAKAVAIQPDGKIVVVGDVVRSASQRDVALVRYNANGTPDLSFGENGRVIVAISNRNEVINAVAIDGNGRIVVAGSIEPSDDTPVTDFLIVRFTPNGALDTTFGNGGAVTVDQGSIDSFNAVAIQSNGRIVAAGGTSDRGYAAVIGFTPNGTIDQSFGDFGLNFFDVPAMMDEQVQVIALRPNGRILVGGQGQVTVPHPGTSSFLAEFDANGEMVQDFGTSGIVRFWAGFIPFGFDMAILPDGSVLAVSDKLYRISTAGAVDSNFGSGINGSEIALRSDGRFVITYSSFLLNQQAGVFAPNGRLIGRDRNLKANDLAVQPDDKIIFITSTETEFVATRITAIASQATRLADFDGDDVTDIAVVRDSVFFYALRSSEGFETRASGSVVATRFIPEDYTGDRRSEYMSWLNNIGTSSEFIYQISPGNYSRFRWGWSDFDIPVGGDYDGDGKTDYAVFRAFGDRYWYILQSSNNQLLAINWGLIEDKPVPADYDYDGITDIAVYRPSQGIWYIRRSSDAGLMSVRWGNASDIPLTGDFDGDGRADFVVYRPSEGTWYLLQTTAGFRAVRFGLENDFPTPGDYDGDGRHDVAVFRQGIWYILGSTRGFYGVQWGVPSDIPVAVRYAY
ncbi:MAG TPA: FG-GAP-like repeat-containing protein [Pyrinomonadaceae bacterium]|jgi:uncharacterized delta-60 repeat protein